MKQFLLLCLLMISGIFGTKAQTCGNEIIPNGVDPTLSTWSANYAPSPATGDVSASGTATGLMSYVDNNGGFANNVLLKNNTAMPLINGHSYDFSVTISVGNADHNTNFGWVIIDAAGNIVQTIDTYRTRDATLYPDKMCNKYTITGNTFVTNNGRDVALEYAFKTYTKSFTFSGATGTSYYIAMTWIGANSLASATVDCIKNGRSDDISFHDVSLISTTPATVTGYNSVCIGATLQLTGSELPATTGAWTSSNPAVASVDNNGVVTGKAAGSTTITYTDIHGCTATKLITVPAACNLTTITGTLYSDNDKNATINDGTGSNLGGSYVAIVDGSGNVVDYVAVAADGSYTVHAPSGGSYTVIITTTKPTVGSPAPASSYPSGYRTVGEGTTTTGDGTPDGSVALTNTAAGSVLVNFSATTLPMPVTFNEISASVRNGQLLINWSTLAEKNFDHFIVEVSKDGVSWKTLTIIQSQAVNGNSDQELKYSVTKSLNEMSTLFGASFNPIALLLLALFTLSFAISLSRKFSATRPMMTILLAISLMGTIASCKKNTDAPLDNDKSKIYVRVTTVDKDGRTEISKIITAVNE